MPDVSPVAGEQATPTPLASTEEPGLGHRAARGGVVVVVAQAARLALLLISLAVLGRLLSPADFGVFAFALAVVGVAELLRDFGLSASAVSAPQLSSAEKSNLFWMNVALGFTLSIIITIAGLLMLALNGNAAVASAMIGLSVVYLLNGIQTQFQVELTRSFRFTAIATTDILSQFLGLVVGISAALLGAGYWSLIVMQIVISVTLLVGRATIARWVPRRPRLDVPMRHHISYGWTVGLSQTLSYFSINAPIYAIGAVAGAHTVGLFSRAAQVVNVPMNQLFAPLTNVALPSLSRVYTRGDFGVHIRSAANIVTLVGAACFTALFAVAPWFTPLILGPSWGDATPILRWLCIGAMFQSATFPFFWVFLASRRTSQLLRYTLVSKPIAIILVVCGAVMGGGEGAAIGLALGFAAAWPICAAWLRSDRTFEVRKLFLDASRILACGLSGILASFAVGSAVNGLATQALVSLVCAAVTCFIVGTLLGVQDCIRRSLAVVARVRTNAVAADADDVPSMINERM